MKHSKKFYAGVIIGKLLLVVAGAIVMKLSLGEAPPTTFDPFAMVCGALIVLFGFSSSFEDW